MTELKAFRVFQANQFFLFPKLVEIEEEFYVFLIVTILQTANVFQGMTFTQ